MKNYSIGLDLGVNNVGWSIMDNDQNRIVKYGIRNFKTSDSAVDRRTARNERRRIKRKDTRIEDVLKILEEINFPATITTDDKLIKKRFVGIKDKIEKQDITNILCYMVSHRGYIPFGDEEVNFVDLKGKLPCEYYYELFNSVGKYRAMNETVRNSENLNEIKAILETQKQYYKDITNEFVNKVIEIFTRKRKFWEGPGGVNQLTPYGRFKTSEDVQNYLREKEKNKNYEKYIFEDLIKNCEISINEKCAPKLNFYAEYFNFLNDFINVSFKDIELVDKKESMVEHDNVFKLNLNGIIAIKNYLIENFDKKIGIKNILKDVLGTTIENVSGYRIDKEQKPEFSLLNFYRISLKTFHEKVLSDEWIKNLDIYNRVMYDFTIAPASIDAIKTICNDKSINYSFNEKEINSLIELYKNFKSKCLLSYHSLSESVLKRATKDMEKYLMNFMQVRKKLDYDKEARE